MVNQFFHDTILVIQHLRQPGSVRIRVSAGLRYVKPENMVSVKLALYVWCSIPWIQLFKIGIPFLKLTARPWKWMVGRWNFLLGWPIFRGELLVSRTVIIAYNWNFCQFCHHFLFGSLVSTQTTSLSVKCGPVAWYQSVLWLQVMVVAPGAGTGLNGEVYKELGHLDWNYPSGNDHISPQKFSTFWLFWRWFLSFPTFGICWSFPGG